MKRLILIVSAIAICLMVQLAMGDVKIVNDVKNLVNGKDRNSGENTSYYKEDRARMEAPGDAVTIIRLDKGVMWILNSKEKTYSEMTAEQMKKLAELMKTEIEPEIKTTEETKEIGEHKCTKTLVTIKMMGTSTTTEVWTSTDIKPDETLMKFSAKMAEVFKDSPNLQASNKMMQIIFDMGAFPIQTYTKAKMMGVASENTSTLKSISTDKLDDSLFELPEDYTQQKMSGMGDVTPKIKDRIKIKNKIGD